MLIHLEPRMYSCRVPCTLIDLSCSELGLSLQGDVDLVARRPYPNKNHLVVCRKVGQKAITGILIKTPAPMREFTVVTRWAVGARHVATHKVKYVVLDDDFDNISENMASWYRMKTFESRWPAKTYEGSPLQLQPLMEVTPGVQRLADSVDQTDSEGFILERSEVFHLPTLERERVLCGERMPLIGSAFDIEELSLRGLSGPTDRIYHLDLSNTFPNVTEVEMLLGGVGTLCFPDGTEQFIDDDEAPVLVFSPRLPQEALDRFCEQNMAHYQAFYDKHKVQLLRCERVAMEPFWKEGGSANES